MLPGVLDVVLPQHGARRGGGSGDRGPMAGPEPGEVGHAGPVGHVRLMLSGGSVLVAGHGEVVAGLVALADPSERSTALITADPALPLGSRPLGAAAVLYTHPTLPTKCEV